MITYNFISCGCPTKCFFFIHFCFISCFSHHHECPENDTKLPDGEVPVMLELWGMQSTPLLPLLQGPFWYRYRVVAPDRVLSMC